MIQKGGPKVAHGPPKIVSHQNTNPLKTRMDSGSRWPTRIWATMIQTPGPHVAHARWWATWATRVMACSKNRQAEMATRKRSPSALSIDRLTAAGYLVGRVEQTIPHTRITRDLWGFVDLLAIREGEVLAVQVTSASNVAARVAKITDHANLAVVRKAGIRIEVHGWRRKAGEDICRVVDLS